MDLAGDLVDGRSVDWARLARTAGATLSIGVVSYVIGLIRLVESAIVTVLNGITWFIGSYLSSAVGIPVEVGDAAFAELSASVSIFGAFAPVVAVLITGATVYVVILGTAAAVRMILGGIA